MRRSWRDTPPARRAFTIRRAECVGSGQAVNGAKADIACGKRLVWHVRRSTCAAEQRNGERTVVGGRGRVARCELSVAAVFLRDSVLMPDLHRPDRTLMEQH